MRIYSNQIECLKCGDKPFSKHRHDFQPCECGEVMVDGGQDYLRRAAASLTNIKDISIEVDDETHNLLMGAMKNEKTNEFGKLCEIARLLRDAGYWNLDRSESPPTDDSTDVGDAPERREAGVTEGLCL